MKRWRRTEIRVERREVTVVRTGGGTASCPVCGPGSAMIHAVDAAAILGLGMEIVQQRLADGKLHGSRSADGNWLVCTNSMRGMSEG
ncbi:MAG: hypothetical protein WAL45_04710 [Terracidiphilus sp.]